MPARMIDTDLKLTPWLPRLAQAPWLAVDTEADSLHAYPEKLCLIQISLPGADLLVDPLAANLDLKPLLKILHGHELVVHGADYDLRLLHRTYGFVPTRIFDTMLAARLVGHREFGLAALLQEHLGVTLEKGSQRADWARRPLSERMERYARNDTRYLHPLVTRLRRELDAKGRRLWLEESCVRLVAEAIRTPEADDDALWRVKGCHRLDRRGLAILRELWHWRETEAIAFNRPPFFILSHEKLVDLAAAAQAHATRVHLPPHLTERRRAGALGAVERGLHLPATALPQFPKRSGRRSTEAELRRMDDIKRIRDRRAHELGIDPTLIASRADLLQLARDWETHARELMSWQRELLRPDSREAEV
jgi:ribonuclease D